MLYGVYSIVVGVADLIVAAQLEWWADIWLIGAPVMLVLSGAFVRVSMPGGLALAIGGLRALQSISLHNAGHQYGLVSLIPELARAIQAVSLVALAYFGWDGDRSHTAPDAD